MKILFVRPLKIWEEWETKKRETAIAKILPCKNLVKLRIQNVDKVESRETNIQEELFSIYVIFTRWVVVHRKFFDQGPNLTKNLPSISTQCFPRVTRAAKLSAGVEPWSLNLSIVTVTLVRDNLGTTFRYLLGNLKTTWGQFWDNLETSLRQLWSMGPQFVNCYCDLETTWGRLWHNFVAICKQLEDNLEPWGLQKQMYFFRGEQNALRGNHEGNSVER